VVVELKLLFTPSAKIPAVLFPAAEPYDPAAVEAVAEVTLSLEYVYLFLVVVGVPLPSAPNAKIPKVEVPAPAPRKDGIEAEVAEATASLE
jgi:hypothetical protein